MTGFDIDQLYVFQELNHSTATLAVMSDSTARAFVEMHKWTYTTKDEMKQLGGTLGLMRNKFIELSILGISKMVEDFFNNLDRCGHTKINIWDTACDSIVFSRDVRFVRHLGNTIKHDNSIIDSRNGGRSAKTLIRDYGLRDETPICWLEVFNGSERDCILQQIYMANEFCLGLLCAHNIIGGKCHELPRDEVIPFMLKHYVHSIPGHPEKDR